MSILNDEFKLKLLVLREITKVMRGVETDKQAVLTVGKVIGYIDLAVENVKAEIALQKS